MESIKTNGRRWNQRHKKNVDFLKENLENDVKISRGGGGGASKCDGRAWPIEDFLTIYMKKNNILYKKNI